MEGRPTSTAARAALAPGAGGTAALRAEAGACAARFDLAAGASRQLGVDGLAHGAARRVGYGGGGRERSSPRGALGARGARHRRRPWWVLLKAGGARGRAARRPPHRPCGLAAGRSEGRGHSRADLLPGTPLYGIPGARPSGPALWYPAAGPRWPMSCIAPRRRTILFLARARPTARHRRGEEPGGQRRRRPDRPAHAQGRDEAAGS